MDQVFCADVQKSKSDSTRSAGQHFATLNLDTALQHCCRETCTMHNTVNTGVMHTTGVSVRSVESSVQVIAVSALLQRTGGSASRTYCSSGPCLSVTVSR